MLCPVAATVKVVYKLPKASAASPMMIYYQGVNGLRLICLHLKTG